MKTKILCRWIADAIAICAVFAAAPTFGGDLAREALTSFPAQTLRVDDVSLARLRQLPDLQKLISSSKFHEIEARLMGAGIRPSDVDEVVIGWSANSQIGGAYGLASGRFAKNRRARRISSPKIRLRSIMHRQALCLSLDVRDPEEVCFLFISDSRLAFGTPAFLNEMLSARERPHDAMPANSEMAALLPTSAQAAIRGTATGSGIVDWFQNLTPGKRDVRANWSRTLQGTETLKYVVRLDGGIQIDVSLGCDNAADADHVMNVLTGYIAMAQAASRNRGPKPGLRIAAFESHVDGQHAILNIVANARTSVAGTHSSEPRGTDGT